jgi:hypothetical protein
MSETPSISRLLVPGGNLERNLDGSFSPSENTKGRAKTTIEYYRSNTETFGPGAFIVISGGHQYALQGDKPQEGVSEAAWYKARFVDADIPLELYEPYTDPDPPDSASNLRSAISKKIFAATWFTPENPLTVVTGYDHWLRMGVFAHYLGFTAGSFVQLETGEQAGPAEGYLLERTEAAFHGMKIGDLDEFETRRLALVEEIHDPANRHNLQLVG